MDINDKRKKHEYNVEFGELSIGDMYEDEDENLCIKTNELSNSTHSNCIAFIDDKWEAHYESYTAKVRYVKATIEIEG